MAGHLENVGLGECRLNREILCQMMSAQKIGNDRTGPMRRHRDFHSRLVIVTKFSLITIAIVLFSSIFLVSQKLSPSALASGEDLDFQQFTQDQEATNATHAGVTTRGNGVSVWSKTSRFVEKNTRVLLDEMVIAKFNLKFETQIVVTAKGAEMNLRSNIASLSEEVKIETTTGYVMTTAHAFINFDNLYAESPGPVEGRAPMGDLKAGRMVLRTDATGENLWMRFSDGVELKFIPQEFKE